MRTTWTKYLEDCSIYIEIGTIYESSRVDDWDLPHMVEGPTYLSLPVGDDRYLNLSSQKATHGPKSRGKSFGTTLWHHVQRYCCLDVLFAHAQVPSNSSSYHIRRNEMN